MQELPLHRTIVVVDVAGFTDPSRTMAHQKDIHESLYEVITQAFAESDLDLKKCEIGDRGDGMMILLPAEIPKSPLADRLPNRLVAALKRHNATRATPARFKLRIAFHSGEVHTNAHGAVSPAVNFAFRIVEAHAAKRALRISDEVLAVIVSDLFYREVIAGDPAANPERYQTIPVEVKETKSTAWLLLPDSPIVQDLLPRTELNQLQKLLATITKADVPQLLTLVRRAGGPTTPPLAQAIDAWDAFQYLWEFNADARGLPPALKFVQLLSCQIADPVRNNLQEWLARQVRHLRLESVVQVRQEQTSTVPAADSRLHLLITVQPDGIHPDRFQLSYWRQDDPDEWPPARGETREVTRATLEHAVDELILAAERAWSSHGGTAALEFLLPRQLLREPVHRWHKEHSSRLPRKLFMDYPVVVRSLERMAAPHWYRVWHDRWATMKNGLSLDGVYFSQLADLDKRNLLDAILTRPQWTLMVLTGPPPPEPLITTGDDELLSALRAGIPALIWHPEASPEDLREIVTKLVEGDSMNDLPERTRLSRLDAVQESPPSPAAMLLHDLVVLWDDPGRTVVLDQPSPQPRP